MTALTILILTGLLVSELARVLLRRRVPTLGRGLLVGFFALIFVIGAGEFGFRNFYAKTEGRLASNNWADRYWRENSRQFRDHEWTPEDWAGKHSILVAGDSIAAGWGIEDPEDRFGDVLADLLGDDYAVINVAQPGLTTFEEQERIEDYPIANPDTIILQYTLNDIEGGAMRLGIEPDYSDPPEIVMHSHLADYIYTRDVQNVGFNQEFWAWNFGAYDSAPIWEAHEADLRAFAEMAAEKNSHLIVVIFPVMNNVIPSIPYVDRVAQVFDDYPHVDVLKLFDAAEAMPLEDRIVSIRDTHPSAQFHHKVAELLYTQYFQAEPAP